MKTLLHVDMDAFFASVELLDHPEWTGRPLIVGAGPHERGVVSTCSYEARRFGVHSAMPSRTAYQLCPQAIFVYPRMERYEEISRKAFEVFEHYSPFVEGVSIDEAFLDITGSVHLFAGARELGEALREEIHRVCGITCSVGIAPNRLLAKIGSEQHKPNGLTMMPFDAEEIAAFLRDKPVSVLWGVGKATVEALKPYGIVTCGDIQRLSQAPGGAAMLSASLVDYAFGRCDDTVYWQEGDEKSVSREHTFGTDESDRETVRAKLLELVDEVGVSFREKKRWATVARIKLRDSAFNTITRQKQFDSPACDDFAFRKAALELFDNEHIDEVRLVGFGVSGIVDSPDASFQPLLFEDPSSSLREKRERLSAAMDSLRSRGYRLS